MAREYSKFASTHKIKVVINNEIRTKYQYYERILNEINSCCNEILFEYLIYWLYTFWKTLANIYVAIIVRLVSFMNTRVRLCKIVITKLWIGKLSPPKTSFYDWWYVTSTVFMYEIIMTHALAFLFRVCVIKVSACCHVFEYFGIHGFTFTRVGWFKTQKVLFH